MMRIDDLTIEESWTEFAVEVDPILHPGLTVDCEDKNEAEFIIGTWVGAKLRQRRCFLSEWYSE